VDIPNDKRIEYSLLYIHGIGPKLAVDVLKEAQIDIGVKAKDLRYGNYNNYYYSSYFKE